VPQAKVQTTDGIVYPRDVECPEGFPPGWKGVQQSYSEASKNHGKTYVRYYSLDGRHKYLSNPRDVISRHCQDLGLDYDTEYAKYEKAVKDKANAKQREAEARGRGKGESREEMITVSRNNFGELTGEIVFAFPGWRCRWDFLRVSGQAPKTFMNPEGREFKLLKDVECMFGTLITRAGSVPSEMAAMLEAGKNNSFAHELFRTGSAKAKEIQGLVLIRLFERLQGLMGPRKASCSFRVDSGGFWWVWGSSGFWWILVGSDGFWWILVGAGGFLLFLGAHGELCLVLVVLGI
jgi:hypothetical protein